MRNIILLCVFLCFGACTTLKSTQKEINSGNYKTAMLDAISKIKKDKNSDKAKSYATLLHTAFRKYKSEINRDIAFLENDSKEIHAEKIYEAYREIKLYQNKIRPLLPLESTENKVLNFHLEDYSDAILKAKTELTDQLFSQALDLIEEKNRYSYREAHHLLKKVERLQPDYSQLKEMQDIAYTNGVSYVLLSTANKTDLILPQKFHQEMLNLDTYHLDDFWTIYHNHRHNQIDYDREVKVEFHRFNFSPERLSEREIPLEREIVDGWRYQKDRRGRYILDGNGDKMKEDNIVLVNGLLLKTVQSKEVQVQANVRFIDLYKNEQIASQELESLFVFENVYAQFQGNAKVLTSDEQLLIRRGFVNFPSNERMLIDAIQDIQMKVKTILKKQS